MIKLNQRQHDPGQPDGGTTAAPSQSPFSPVTLDTLAAAKAVIEALGPPPPRVEFFEAPRVGEGWIAVFLNDEPAGVLSPEKFAELKARLKEMPR